MAKKVAMFEKLKQGMLEGIRVRICDFILWDCDWCPTFISSRCPENCNDKEAEEVDTNRTVGNS